MKVGVSKRDFLHRLRYNMLDLWISPLPYLKDETREKTTVAEKKIIVVPLGLEAEVFLQSQLTRSSARMQLNLPAEADVIGVLGRIDPKKGQDFIVCAIAQLRDRYSRLYHLLIMGNITHGEGDRYLNHLHGLVRKHKLEELVHFSPYHEDVNLFYKAIDVFAMPSQGETYGMVTLEAMISECPVIGVDRDGTSAILQRGRLGWLYELEDIDDFCRKLFDLEQSGKKQDILLAAKQEVLDNYSMDRAMSETNQALQLLLQQ
jgi:glycosyltransferase involved in cell wall biosynthesis